MLQCLLHTLLLVACLTLPALASPPVSVMVGPVEMTEARIWVQTSAPAQVQIRYQPEGEPQLQRISKTYWTDEAHYLTQVIPLTDLQPDRVYTWEVWLNGQVHTLPFQPRFRTQPLWRHRTEPPPLRLALGSCVYLNDPDSDVPGHVLGGNYEIFEAIRQSQPDFMLWMGDNVYLREPDFTSPTRLNVRYRQLRELPQARPLFGSLPHYAIWDDHDFGPNDSDRSYRLRFESLDIFRHYWPASVRWPQAGGIYQNFEWGDAEFFLTDNRFFRAPNAMPDPQRDFFGPVQTAWLREALTASRARFKFIVIGNQVLNTKNPSENFYSYSREFQDFLKWLEQSQIPGIMLLSGDRHHSELLKKERPGTYPLYEWTVSPLTSQAYPPFAVEKDLLERVPGSLVATRNFGLLEISGPAGARVLDLQLRSPQGTLLWRQRIAQQELGLMKH